MEKLSAVPDLASFYLTAGSAQSMIQNKQVEALITGTSPPIVALIPFAGGGGSREGIVTRPFLTFQLCLDQHRRCQCQPGNPHQDTGLQEEPNSLK